MPTIPAIAPKRDAWRSQQDHLTRLPYISRTLQRRRNLTGGLRSQQRVLVDPTGMFTAEGDFFRVITEQTVVLFSGNYPRPCLDFCLGPAFFKKPKEDFIQQQSYGVIGSALLGEVLQ